MLVIAASFREPWEAHIFCARLRAEGLFARVAHEHHIANNWAYSTALGGVKVQVLSDQLDAVRAIERLSTEGEFELILKEKFGDLDNLKCPVCSSQDNWKRRPLIQGSFAVAISFLFVIFPPWNWLHFCENCGAIFRQKYGLIGKSGCECLPKMIFSEATPADVAEISALQKMGKFEEGSTGWTCRIDGILRGFALADLRAKRLSAIFVHSDFERSGMGRTLHNFAVDWLFENGTTKIELIVDPQTSAMKFFHAAGWKLADSEENGDYRLELQSEIWRSRRTKF